MAIAAELKTPATGIKALKQRAADLLAGMKDVRAKLGNTALSADERETLKADFKALEALADENDTDLQAEQRIQERERTLAARPDPDALAADRGRSRAGIPRVEVVEDESDKQAKSPGYFGRQLQAVHSYAAHGGQLEELSAAERNLLKPMMVATGLNTDIGSDGGFLVAQDRSSNVVQRVYTQGEVAKRVNRIPISAGSNGITLPAIDETSRADGSRFGGIASGWLGQGNTLTSGKPKFRPMDMKLRKVGAFVYATDELLADATALEAWVNKYLPMELTFRAEDSFLNGIGSNQPVGVMASGAVLTVTRNTASRILSEDLRAMVNRLWAPLWGGAAFFVDQSTLGEFDQLAVPVGTGGVLDPSYKPAGSVAGQTYATYKGIPIIPVEYCAALGTSGDIILANLSEYTVIDKGGVEQAVSMHVAFLTAEQVFRFMYRVDGQANWNSALTPKSGGDTLSFAVVLS